MDRHIFFLFYNLLNFRLFDQERKRWTGEEYVLC